MRIHSLRTLRAAGATALGLLATALPARAQTCTGSPPVCVATTAAELSAAIPIVSAAGGTISLGNSITLSTPITIDTTTAITVEGNGFTLSGGNTSQALIVKNSSGGPALTIQDLTIANASVTGGAGGSGGAGAAGGGGGAAMGAGLTVLSGATVNVSNVNVESNAATGGAGGSGSPVAGLGGGGTGGAFNTTGGGGGAGGLAGTSPNGGTATAFGGGGGGAAQAAATGGAGNFNNVVGAESAGGAGGSTNGTSATSLFAGGTGGAAVGGTGTGGGGGGAALGGGIFVQSGGQLTVAGAFYVNGNRVTGGAGGAGGSGGTAGTAGGALGAGLFLDGGTLTLTSNSNVTIADAIGGDSGADIQKSGTGTLTLGGNNTFTGSVTVSQGTLSISSDANLGIGGNTLLGDGTTLAITQSGTYTHGVQLGTNSGATMAPSAGTTAVWNGRLSNGDGGPTQLFVKGGGTLVLGSVNTYRGGTVVSGGSTLSINADANLGAGNASVTLGDASSTGTLAITTPGAFSSARPIALGAGGGILDIASATTATLSGNVTGTGGLTKNGAGSVTLSGTNTYTGATTVNAGVLIAGSGTPFGSAPSIAIASAGTVDFAGQSLSLNSLSGTGTLLLSSGATMTLGTNNADNAFGGTIGGTGGILKNGSGTLTLTAANTFSGGTSVAGGTLAVNAGGLGSGVLTLSNGTALSLLGSGTFANNVQLASSSISVAAGTTVAWNGTISDFGSGGVVQLSGGGTLVLGSASNSYSGGTTVTGGTTVQVASDGALGAAGGTVRLGDASTAGTLAVTGSLTSSRALVFNPGGATIDVATGSSAGLTGAATGTGGLTKTGAGTLTLGPATYGGPTNVAAGTLRAGAATSFGTSGSLSIASGATVDLNGFNQSFNALSGSGTLALNGGASLSLGGGGANIAFGGSLIGSGGVVKNGGGILTLTGNNSYAGGTTVNAGVFLGNTASVQGNILNNASVVFDQSGTGTYAGAMSGSGSLVKNGAGTLTLAGANSYSGGTFVNAGTLVGDSSSLQGTIVNNASIVLDETSTGTFNGTILGNGSLTKAGTGTLTINDANPFGGAVNVGEGALVLNGSFAGDVNVASGASLRSAGTIGGSLNLDGTLVVPAPAISTASLAATRLGAKPRDASVVPSIVIDGNLNANPGSVLDFTVTPNGAAPIVVNGFAILNGTHISATVLDPHPARNATYLGLVSNGLTINGVDAFSPTAGIVPVFKYDPRSISITLLNENIPLGGIVSTPNAASAGGAIDRLKSSMGSDLAFVVRELTALPDGALDTALRQISGELHSTQLRVTADDATLISDLVRDVLSDREDDEPSGARPLTGAQSMRWWFQMTGDHGHYSPAGFDAATANTGGGGGGLDFHPTSSIILGGGGAFSLADMSMASLGGSSNMQAPRAFGYGGYTAGPFGIHLGGSAARTTYTTQRPIVFAAAVPSPDGPQPLSQGVDRVADANQTGVVKDGWTELKDAFKRGGWSYSWKIGWRTATYDRNPFTETGGQSLSLTGLADTLKTKEADVDINAFKRTGAWRPRVWVSYRRELGDLATASNVQLTDQPAGQFVVNGVPIPQQDFHGIFGVTMRSRLGVEYTFEYEMRRAPSENHDGVHFRVRFK